MSILGKSASALIKAANNGNMGAIDKLADSVASLDLSKMKDVSRDKKKKVTDYTRLSGGIRRARTDKRDARTKMREYVNLYEELIMVADELNVKVSIENDFSAFTTSVVFRTDHEMTNVFGSFKKVFKGLNKDIEGFDTIKKEYTSIIMRIKTAERDAIKEHKYIETLEKKILQLNTSIEALKK